MFEFESYPKQFLPTFICLIVCTTEKAIDLIEFQKPPVNLHPPSAFRSLNFFSFIQNISFHFMSSTFWSRTLLNGPGEFESKSERTNGRKRKSSKRKKETNTFLVERPIAWSIWNVLSPIRLDIALFEKRLLVDKEAAPIRVTMITIR